MKKYMVVTPTLIAWVHQFNSEAAAWNRVCSVKRMKANTKTQGELRGLGWVVKPVSR